jgi:hypothetical protein
MDGFDEIIAAAGISVPDDGSHLINRTLGGSRVSFCVFRTEGAPPSTQEENCEVPTRP